MPPQLRRFFCVLTLIGSKLITILIRESDASGTKREANEAQEHEAIARKVVAKRHDTSRR
jgi:hypothetical protein